MDPTLKPVFDGFQSLDLFSNQKEKINLFENKLVEQIPEFQPTPQSVATTIEQIKSEVVSGRKERAKEQNQKFTALIEKFKSGKGREDTEKAFKEGTVKIVAPLTASQQATGASFEEYFSFAQNPANAGKIILGVRATGLELGRCVLTKQKGANYIAVIGDDQVATHLCSEKQQEITDQFLRALRGQFGSNNVDRYFSQRDYEEILMHGLSGNKIRRTIDFLDRNISMDVVDHTNEEAKSLKVQVATLGKQYDQIRIEGGAKNKKVLDQARFLKQKSKDLITLLQPLKGHSNSNIRDNARYVEHKLKKNLDAVGQLVEETQRNRNLIDGLGLETKQSYGKPLSNKEAEEIINNQDINLTWRDAGEENILGDKFS